MSRRSEILVALEAALNGAGLPGGATVHRSRTRPIEKDALPALVLYLLDESTEAKSSGAYKARRAMRVRVECRTTADADTAPDDAVDPLLSHVVRAILADPRQGGLAVKTEETGTTWDAAEDDLLYAAAAVDFTLDYITAAGDPDVA